MGQCSAILEEVKKKNVGGASKFKQTENVFFFCKYFKMLTFYQFSSDTFFKTPRHLTYVDIIFRTEGSKKFNFWKDFCFALSANYLLQGHATHVCFHISVSVIIHHQTLTGWKFYCEERKHQGILSFYPKRIIYKKDYKAKQVTATTSTSIGVRAIFLPGGAVKHLPKKFLQVAQIFMKQ